jgi:type IV pilus assembly protein PilB
VPIRDVPAVTPLAGADKERRRLGDVVVELGLADRETVEKAAVEARERGLTIGEALVEDGALSPDQLARALAERNGLDYVDLSVFEVDKGAANLLSAAEARRFRALPVAFLDAETILVATANPANVLGLDDIAITTGYRLRPAVTSPEDIEAVISQLSDLAASLQEVAEETPEQDLGDPVIELRESAVEAPVVKLVYSIIADAVARGASDIHFEPRNDDMRVRFRVDGVVMDSATVTRRLAPGLVSRIKIMAELDIAERRAPAGRARRAHGRWPSRRHQGGDTPGGSRGIGRGARPRQGARRHRPRPARDGACGSRPSGAVHQEASARRSSGATVSSTPPKKSTRTRQSGAGVARESATAGGSGCTR